MTVSPSFKAVIFPFSSIVATEGSLTVYLASFVFSSSLNFILTLSVSPSSIRKMFCESVNSGFFTVTVNTASLAPSICTMILTVPSPTNVIFPFSSTVATEGSLEVYSAADVTLLPFNITKICSMSRVSSPIT